MTSSNSDREASVREQFQIVFGFLGLIWLVHLMDWILRLDLNKYGLVPRSLSGLIGIFTMPLLHGSWGHLMSNSVPLVILLCLMIGTHNRPWLMVGAIWLLGGCLLWCIGRYRIHIGASGLVYGLVAYLIGYGWFSRKFVSVLISLFVGFVYGMSLLFSVLPTAGIGVSWEGHLSGAIAGFAMAYVAGRRSDKEALFPTETWMRSNSVD